MNEENKNIDELFSKSLSEPEILYMEADWAAMKQKLEKDKKRRGIVWWSATSGIAAALLIAVAWWNFSSEPASTGIKMVKAPIVKYRAAGEAVLEGAQPGITDEQEPVDHVIEQSSAVPNIAHTEQPKRKSLSRLPEKAHEGAAGRIEKVFQTYHGALASSLQNNNPGSVAGMQYPDSTSTQNQNAVVALAAKADISTDAAAKEDSSRIVAKTNTKFKPSIILSLTAAPGVSAVNSFASNKLDFGGGLLATVTLSAKLSVSSGAVVARKLYGTGFANYKPNGGYKFITSPVNVNADCRVLDIPLNINYTIWQKQKSSFQLSAGASSYIMLTENYEYQYASNYVKGPYSYEVRNLNKHYLGVGNFAVAYRRTFNNTTAISIQPYLKLPLTGIGYGNVKLLSTGVAVNLDMNLSTIIKEK